MLYGFHYCDIQETDAFMTKLHPAEVQSLWFLSQAKNLFRSPWTGLETLAGRIRPVGCTLGTS